MLGTLKQRLSTAKVRRRFWTIASALTFPVFGSFALVNIYEYPQHRNNQLAWSILLMLIIEGLILILLRAMRIISALYGINTRLRTDHGELLSAAEILKDRYVALQTAHEEMKVQNMHLLTENQRLKNPKHTVSHSAPGDAQA